MPIPRYPLGASWPILAAGFRPFFLVAGLWACAAMILWIPMLAGTLVLPTSFSPVTWHFHELMFGFVGAAIAGFLLTAVPNWTGRLPLQGWRLGLLVLLWTAGRLAVAISVWSGPVPAAVTDVAFFVVFGLALSREIIAGRNWRNLPVLVALSVLVAANVMIHYGAAGNSTWEEAGKRLAVGVIVMLIAFIGGRVIPSFTANWLRKRNVQNTPSAFGPYDIATLALTGLALLSWVIVPYLTVSNVLLLSAALANAIRLARWRGLATRHEALLWILHVAYAWIPLGLFLLGIAPWWPPAFTGAVHALTAGAMGTMIVAMMTRASLGHSQRELTAGRGTVIVYAIILIAGLARIAAPFWPTFYDAAIRLAGLAWIVGFAGFVVLYFPLYVQPPRAP